MPRIKVKPNKVSVVIISWNRKEELDRCLESVISQDYLDTEIIVVDNGSREDILEMVKSKYSQVILIRNDKNLGSAKARNQGVLVSEGEYIWFLDNDSFVPSKDCLSQMIEILKDNRIGAVGGQLLIDNNEKKILIHRHMLNGLGTILELEISDCHLKKTQFLATANCLVRRHLLFEIGGFDTHYFYLYEDKDIGFKINRLGYDLVIDNRVAVIHKPSRVQRAENFYLLHRNRIRWVMINGSIFTIMFLPFLDIFFSVLFLPKDLSRLKQRNIQKISSISKYLSKGHEKSNSFIKKIVLVGGFYMNGLLRGYLWNILFLLPTLYVRFKKPNYLKV